MNKAVSETVYTFKIKLLLEIVQDRRLSRIQRLSRIGDCPRLEIVRDRRLSQIQRLSRIGDCSEIVRDWRLSRIWILSRVGDCQGPEIVQVL